MKLPAPCLFLSILSACLSTAAAFSVHKESHRQHHSVLAGTKGFAKDNVKECTVWFGTNRRKKEDPKTGGFVFTEERASSTTWGKATVYVPKSHKRTSTRSSAKQSSNVPEVESRIPLNQETVFAGIREFMKDPGEKDVLLFLHGFYNTFDDVVDSTAQLAMDLDMNGRTAFFSWPSKGRISANLMASFFSGPFVSAYVSDEATIQASERAISEFLLSFATKCVDNEGTPAKVHVVSHSMGNRALLRVLQKVAMETEKRDKLKLGQVIMAAPDVDSDVFKHQIEDICTMMPAGSIERITVYASDGDMAIRASAIFHDYPRAGAEANEHVDTIKVPNIGGDLIGHQYYAKSKNLIEDIQALLATNAPPGSSRRKYVFSPDGHHDSVGPQNVVWKLRMVNQKIA